jgi:Reverse transcriptase (RNA-dependent DNA polymerase)
VGEQIPIFNINIVQPLTNTNVPAHAIINQQTLDQPTNQSTLDQLILDQINNQPTIPIELQWSTQAPQQARLNFTEYKRHETTGKSEGQDWATVVFDCSEDDRNVIVCITETKASHQILWSYKHAMAMDPEWWMEPMMIEMNTLKLKNTWNLVKPPPGANIMELMWIFDIKWDGEENQIKDKDRLVGKWYTQQLGIDYNETWAGVTRLESVQMTAAIAAKLDLKLWQIDFVRAYLNSLTKEDIYMKQPEGFVKAGYKDYICKLVHTIYGMMQGGHNWYVTLSETYNSLGYTASHADPCVWFKKEDRNYTITNTYTDNIFGASNNNKEVSKRKDKMGRVWEIKDVGENIFSWDVSSTRSDFGNNLPYSMTILETHSQSIQPGTRHTTEHSLAYWYKFG